MRTWARLGLFGTGIAVLFVAAMGAGQAVGPVRAAAPAVPPHSEGGHSAAAPAPHGDSTHGADAVAPDPVGGLGVSHDGYTVVPSGPVTFTADATAPLRFTVTDDSGVPVTDFAVNHDRRMHLVLARRDLSGYQHVHPTMAPDGTWSVPLTLREPGSYRAFADFVPAGRKKAITLGVDLTVPGDAAARPLPEPSRTAQVGDGYTGDGYTGDGYTGDGYTVELDGHLHAGSADTLSFEVLRNGRPVTALEPYLGELGHLVILRRGDMGYLHVHATDGPNPTAIAFDAAAPTAGTYRMYLDFKHEGQVRTAEFTAVVREGSR